MVDKVIRDRMRMLADVADGIRARRTAAASAATAAVDAILSRRVEVRGTALSCSVIPLR
ncbi:hypothetical protein DEU32_10827 [Curtobacterium sp. AG1037]|nr:hypothetical protein DEU32_10827 [Curtobacterium sp. AG1037]